LEVDFNGQNIKPITLYVLFRNGNVAFVTWLVSLWKPMALSVQLFSMTLHIPRQSDVVAFLINTNHVCHNIIGSNYTAPRFTCNILTRSRRDGVYQMPMLLLDDDYAHAVWRQRRNLPRKLAVLKATTEPIWAVRWRRRPRRQLDDVCGRGNRRRWPAATSSY